MSAPEPSGAHPDGQWRLDNETPFQYMKHCMGMEDPDDGYFGS